MEETDRVRTGTRKLEKEVWTGVSSRSPGQKKKSVVQCMGFDHNCVSKLRGTPLPTYYYRWAWQYTVLHITEDHS